MSGEVIYMRKYHSPRNFGRTTPKFASNKISETSRAKTERYTRGYKIYRLPKLLLINESLNGSFSQGKMEGSVHKFFTQDTYYLRSNFNVKILRLFNIKRDEGYIISFSDSTVTKINHKKKRFAVYSFSEFLEEEKNNPQGGPPQEDKEDDNESNSDEEDVTINISKEIESLIS